MIHKKSIVSIFLAAALLTAVAGFIPTWGIAAPPAAEEVQPQQQEQLLQNPGFEGITCRSGSEPPECLDNWTHDVHWSDEPVHDNIFTPQGWVTWWRRGGNYGQPEVKTIPNVAPFTGELPRIHSGHYAVLLFTYFRLQDTGLYQCVSNLSPGATVQLSAYAHGWSCDKDKPMGYSCGDPYNQLFQVGIEPNGNADPFSPGIVWSGETRAPDRYKQIGPAEAQVGEGGRVCVFLRSKTKWMYKYQDAYWDDASLVYTSNPDPVEPTSPPAPPPAQPTAGPSPTPFPTPTPRPDGAVVHVVQSGETLYSISAKYAVPLDQIRQLNASSLGGGNIIRPGQELVIAIPDTAPTATSPPTPTPQAAAEGEGGGTGDTTSQGEATSICVLSYHDRDQNGSRGDPSIEELLPEARIILVNADGQPINQYITDSFNEPHCFTALAPGSYQLIQESPAGYASSGDPQQVVSLSPGTSVDVPFGNVRDENAAAENTTSDPADTASGGNAGWMQSAFSTLLKVGGVLLLLACIGAGVFYFLNQRRMAM